MDGRAGGRTDGRADRRTDGWLYSSVQHIDLKFEVLFRRSNGIYLKGWDEGSRDANSWSSFGGQTITFSIL